MNKKVRTILLTCLAVVVVVALHGFYFDWLEFVPTGDGMKLVVGRNNILQAYQNVDPELKLRNLLSEAVDYNTLETEHFIIHYPQDFEFSKTDADRMEQAYVEVNEFWGVDCMAELGRKLHFISAPGVDSNGNSRIVKLIGFEGGMAKSTLGLFYSRRTYSPHELNHVVSRCVGRPVTLLNEGFANYFNKVNWEQNVAERLRSFAEDNALLSLHRLIDNKEFREHDGWITYPQASVFVKYLVEEQGKDKFKELYQRSHFTVRDHAQEFVNLIAEIYGMDIDTLNDEYQEYMLDVIGY